VCLPACAARLRRGKVPALAESAEESLNRKRSHEQAQLARDNAPARRKVAKPRPPELRTNDLAATGINPQPRHVAPVREGESVTVVGREREVEEILGFCKQCVTGGGGGRGGPSASGGRGVHGGSLYISGAPGVGKTLTIHTVQRLLASWR
jgi:Cdc6-like AAA superfamily ATPase